MVEKINKYALAEQKVNETILRFEQVEELKYIKAMIKNHEHLDIQNKINK